jgi:membrane protease subunit HflC
MGGILRGGALILIAVLGFIGLNSIFTVHQTQHALVLRFGEPKRSLSEAGLYFKLPFVESVIAIDNRILDLDRPTQEVIASDQKRLVVDSFTRWRVTDPLRFFQAVGSIPGANVRLSSIVDSTVRGVLADASFTSIVRNDRVQLMNQIRDAVNRQAQGLGITIVDTRLTRVDLPEANSQAVFRRMQTERQREAADIRAQGSEQAQGIRARADRDVAQILGQANQRAEETRGGADAERNRIFAEAYGKDQAFFNFYRSMQAYETGLKPGDTRMILSPDSDFFRYFGEPSGRRGGEGAATAK